MTTSGLDRLRRCYWRVTVVLLLSSCLLPDWSEAQGLDDPEGSGEWRVFGSFSGAADSGMAQQIWDILLEMENDGDLYNDLGALSLGLGADLGEDGDIDWDNYFTRRVQPMHEEIPAGSELTAEHISRYADLQTLVTRGRVRYTYIPDLVDERGINFEVEGGVSLSLARARPALSLGTRPLEEILEQRELDSFRIMSEELMKERTNNLLGLAASGTRAVTQWIADGVGRRADTERATLFWEAYGDPATLGFDLGVPVQVDLFSSADPRLGPDDRVRHLTFIGISPVTFRLRGSGLRFTLRYFFRYLRETTIVEEGNDQVLVTVRNLGSRGIELVPLKVRPELRVLGIFTLGYTFFEERWDQGHMASSEMAYRVDLRHPRGRESLAAFLGDGTEISFRPLSEAARDREGVERLDWATRQGSSHRGIRRLQFFNPFSYSLRRTTSLQKVRHEELEYNELTVARNSRYRKSWGKDTDWSRQFLLQSLVNPEAAEKGFSLHDGSSAAVTLLTTLNDSHTEPENLRRAATTLETMFGPHPALAELAAGPDFAQHAFYNAEINFGPHHLDRIGSATENEIWAVLAEVLLGPEHVREWFFAEGRERWSRKKYRNTFAATHGEQVVSRQVPGYKPLSLQGRFRFAGRVLKRVQRLQQLIREGECTSCAHSAFRRWRQIPSIQVVLFRLAERDDGQEPGYRYEIFADHMLRPVTVSNEIHHEYSPQGDPENSREVAIDRSLAADTFQARISAEAGDWFGRKHFMSPSVDRLQAGILLRKVAPDPTGQDYCLKLRIFTDYKIEPGLSLRVDLREARETKADIPLRVSLYRFGEPTKIEQTPFRTAQFHYDIPLPFIDALPSKTFHTLLLRILNPEGYPVSEEQQIRFRTNELGEQALPAGCKLGIEEEFFSEEIPGRVAGDRSE